MRFPEPTPGHLWFQVRLFDIRSSGERMSRRSSRYKGGVTRGREEQPQGNSTMKRGSPKTKKAGSKSNTAAREIEFQHASQKVGKMDDKNEDC